MFSGIGRASEPPDGLEFASDRLFEALDLETTRCPTEAADLHPSRRVLCGVTELGVGEFRRRVDEILADRETIGVSAVGRGSWQKDEGIRYQKYDVADRFIEVELYGRTGKVVISYPKRFAICGTPGAPALAPPDLEQTVDRPPTVKPEMKTPPLYPEIGRKARVQGNVFLQAVVGTDGVPKDICAVRTMAGGALGFEYAAIQAARSWRWEPAMRDGLAVEYLVGIRIAFDLR